MSDLLDFSEALPEIIKGRPWRYTAKSGSLIPKEGWLEGLPRVSPDAEYGGVLLAKVQDDQYDMPAGIDFEHICRASCIELKPPESMSGPEALLAMNQGRIVRDTGSTLEARICHGDNENPVAEIAMVELSRMDKAQIYRRMAEVAARIYEVQKEEQIWITGHISSDGSGRGFNFHFEACFDQGRTTVMANDVPLIIDEGLKFDVAEARLLEAAEHLEKHNRGDSDE